MDVSIMRDRDSWLTMKTATPRQLATTLSPSCAPRPQSKLDLSQAQSPYVLPPVPQQSESNDKLCVQYKVYNVYLTVNDI